MRISTRYCSHLPALMKVMSLTDGDVLELGTGTFSTPILHYLCVYNQRNLVSYDNYEDWLNIWKRYEGPYHKLILVDDWDKADIERFWDVALVDHSPDYRRKEEVKRLSDYARYILIHD